MDNKTIIIKKKSNVRKNIKLDDRLFQIPADLLINKLYLGIECEGNKAAKSCIMKKLSCYQMQDKKKKKFDPDKFITYEQLIETLVASKIKCRYCRQCLKIFYQQTREPLQWTLDRIDNTKGHNQNNVVIACLKCNLERRTRNDKKFLFSKQMKIIKK